EQRLGTLVMDGERPHAIEPIDALFAPVGISSQQDLGIRRCVKHVSKRLKLGAQLKIVIDFPVVRNPDRMLPVAHRLGSIVSQIDDGQSSVSQPDISAYPQTSAVWTTVRDQIREPSNHVGISRSNLIQKAKYSAHARLSRLTFANDFVSARKPFGVLHS